MPKHDQLSWQMATWDFKKFGLRHAIGEIIASPWHVKVVHDQKEVMTFESFCRSNCSTFKKAFQMHLDFHHNEFLAIVVRENYCIRVYFPFINDENHETICKIVLFYFEWFDVDSRAKNEPSKCPLKLTHTPNSRSRVGGRSLPCVILPHGKCVWEYGKWSLVNGTTNVVYLTSKLYLMTIAY